MSSTGEWTPSPPSPPVGGGNPKPRPVLAPDLDVNAPIFEQAKQASRALAEMGIDADQALSIIMVTIATAEDVRAESSKWLTEFTEKVVALVEEHEAVSGNRGRGGRW